MNVLFKKVANVVKNAAKNAGQAAVSSATNAAVQTVAQSIVPNNVPNVPTVTTNSVVNPANTRQKNYIPWIVGGAVGLALIIALASGGSSKKRK